MAIYTIYKATNKINGKSYIGFAKRWPYRKTEHLNESYRVNAVCYNTHFHRAIRKHGWDNFDWEVLYQSSDGNHTLKVMEAHFISEYDTFENGYNQTKGGEGSLGRKHSEETKAKIREKRKQQVFTEETKKLWSEQRKGVPKSQSHRNNMKGNRNALGAVFTRKQYKVISPIGEVFIVDGAKGLEQYVPYWVCQLGHTVKAGKYKGWRAFVMDGATQKSAHTLA